MCCPCSRILLSCILLHRAPALAWLRGHAEARCEHNGAHKHTVGTLSLEALAPMACAPPRVEWKGVFPAAHMDADGTDAEMGCRICSNKMGPFAPDVNCKASP